MSNRTKLIVLSSVFFFTIMTRSATAHFPWLLVDQEQRHAFYFFGESPADSSYKLPEPIAKAKIVRADAKQGDEIEFVAVETDNFVGLRSKRPIDRGVSLSTHLTFGVYGGSKLDYYAMYQGTIDQRKGDEPVAFKEILRNIDRPLHDLDAFVSRDGERLVVQLVWKKRPLSRTKVQLFDANGEELNSGKTNDNGRVSFPLDQSTNGLFGLLVGHTDQSDVGMINGRRYRSVNHYLTVCFHNDMTEGQAETEQ